MLPNPQPLDLAIDRIATLIEDARWHFDVATGNGNAPAITHFAGIIHGLNLSLRAINEDI